MTTEQRIINAQIRHALTTGAVPIEITDAPERDGAIRNLVYETGVKVGEKFTVTKRRSRSMEYRYSLRKNGKK